MTELSAISASDSIKASDGVNRGIVLHDVDASSDSTTTMSFGDFLDMINPLQHIPIVSAAYRGITGDEISPVSRIAGDTLYAGALGVASAGVAALAAIGDEIFAANNDGRNASGSLVASLFGTDRPASGDTPKTQLAQATPAETAQTPVANPALQADTAPPAPAFATATAETQQPAPAATETQLATATGSPPASTLIAPTAYTGKVFNPAPPAPVSAGTAMAAMATSDPTKGMPQGLQQGMALDRSKAPYGGVMDTTMMQNALQNQSLALAMASGKNSLQGEHVMRNNRFAGVTAPTATTATTSPAMASTSTTVSTPVPAATATPPATAQTAAGSSQAIPQALIDDLRAMRGLGNYRNAAQSLPVAGSSVDVTN